MEACARPLLERRGQERSRADGCASRGRTACSTAAADIILGWRRVDDDPVGLPGLAAVALAHACEQREVALVHVAAGGLALHGRFRRDVEEAPSRPASAAGAESRRARPDRGPAPRRTRRSTRDSDRRSRRRRRRARGRGEACTRTGWRRRGAASRRARTRARRPAPSRFPARSACCSRGTKSGGRASRPVRAACADARACVSLPL